MTSSPHSHSSKAHKYISDDCILEAKLSQMTVDVIEEYCFTMQAVLKGFINDLISDGMLKTGVGRLSVQAFNDRLKELGWIGKTREGESKRDGLLGKREK